MPDDDPNAPPLAPKPNTLRSALRGLARRASSALGSLAQEPGPSTESTPGDRVIGHCDGYSEDAVQGWAWRPDRPHDRVEIELWVDGVLSGQTTARILRGDLRDSGIGDGEYGWRLPLQLDPARSTPAKVEARVAGGGVLPNGILKLTFDATEVGPADTPGPEASPEPPPVKAKPDDIVGSFDGIDNRALFGWAWRPSRPGEHVIVELWVDGVLTAATVANTFRGDLLESGIGDGRYGWNIPLNLNPAPDAAVTVEVRTQDGGTIQNGRLQLTHDPSQVEPVESSTASPPPPPTVTKTGVAGALDGVRDGFVSGWAWQPARPEEHVRVGLWVDGKRVDETVAKEPRADLSAAGMGHGRYGWRFSIARDPAQTTSFKAEIRTQAGEILPNGQFELPAGPNLVGAASEHAGQSRDKVEGACDGYREGALHGWAWRPNRPEDCADVELRVDGVLTGETQARIFRPDLRANGIGHGRYGWRLPLALDPTRSQPLSIEVRARGGDPLANGVFELRDDLPLIDPSNESLRPFVASVLAGAATPSIPAVSSPPPVVNILLYCPEPRAPRPFAAREYDDYRAAMNAFRPVLEGLGRVSIIDRPEDANAIHEERGRAGESTLLMSFTQPHDMPAGLNCPAVPVFAWAFPTIPNKAIAADVRTDWRDSLREAGRAIVFSGFARNALLAEMGPDFPVMDIPPPLFDRCPAVPLSQFPLPEVEISVRGVIFDSRNYDLVAGATALPIPIASPEADGTGRSSVKLSGTVFTAVLDFADGRKNWKDIIRAFRAAHRHNRDATLVLKLSEPRAQWWEDLSRLLVRNSPFACQVVALRGDMADEDYRALIGATHWVVNASNAEGVNLPMMEFMSAERPTITPVHTALADYVDSLNSLIVASDEEEWLWPQQATEGEGFSWTLPPEAVTPTTRRRLSWSGLCAAFSEAYRLSTADHARYVAMAAAARESMRRFCRDEVVAARLDGFLGLSQRRAETPESPSRLVSEFGRE